LFYQIDPTDNIAKTILLDGAEKQNKKKHQYAASQSASDFLHVLPIPEIDQF
jgi:hypothetical protein